MVLGKNAENEKLTLLQTVENCFGQLGQNAENYVYDTLRLYFCKKNGVLVVRDGLKLHIKIIK
jgi:hypothetical protein